MNLQQQSLERKIYDDGSPINRGLGYSTELTSHEEQKAVAALITQHGFLIHNDWNSLDSLKKAHSRFIKSEVLLPKVQADVSYPSGHLLKEIDEKIKGIASQLQLLAKENEDECPQLVFEPRKIFLAEPMSELSLCEDFESYVSYNCGEKKSVCYGQHIGCSVCKPKMEKKEGEMEWNISAKQRLLKSWTDDFKKGTSRSKPPGRLMMKDGITVESHRLPKSYRVIRRKHLSDVELHKCIYLGTILEILEIIMKMYKKKSKFEFIKKINFGGYICHGL